jgi:hypothetical protein
LLDFNAGEIIFKQAAHIRLGETLKSAWPGSPIKNFFSEDFLLREIFFFVPFFRARLHWPDGNLRIDPMPLLRATL